MNESSSEIKVTSGRKQIYFSFSVSGSSYFITFLFIMSYPNLSDDCVKLRIISFRPSETASSRRWDRLRQIITDSRLFAQVTAPASRVFIYFLSHPVLPLFLFLLILAPDVIFSFILLPYCFLYSLIINTFLFSVYIYIFFLFII
jgi:hypothetical protein